LAPDRKGAKSIMIRSLLLRSCALLLTAILPILAGCTGNGLNLATVHGKVTYKGEPVKNGTVFFMPDDSKGNNGPGALGPITSDGTYIMSTESSGDGAVVGSYKVGINGFSSEPVSEEAAPEPESDPLGYMKAKAKSAAEATTGRPKKEDDLFTDRAGRKWRYIVPKKFSDPRESGIITRVESGSNTMNFEIDESGNVRITK
jgi:hypothetical protein